MNFIGDVKKSIYTVNSRSCKLFFIIRLKSNERNWIFLQKEGWALVWKEKQNKTKQKQVLQHNSGGSRYIEREGTLRKRGPPLKNSQNKKRKIIFGSEILTP
jgi:hypothetical protein